MSVSRVGSEMNVLDRASFLANEDLYIEQVSLPNEKDAVYIRELSGQQRDEWERMSQEWTELRKTDEAKAFERFQWFRLWLIINTVCDEHGTTILTEGDFPLLLRKSAKMLNHLYDEAARISSLTNETLQDEEKN